LRRNDRQEILQSTNRLLSEVKALFRREVNVLDGYPKDMKFKKANEVNTGELIFGGLSQTEHDETRFEFLFVCLVSFVGFVCFSFSFWFAFSFCSGELRLSFSENQ
jgi:hypothetical protein